MMCETCGCKDEDCGCDEDVCRQCGGCRKHGTCTCGEEKKNE